MRAVFDTNILVSGLISPKGSPAKLLNFWQKREFILITSKKILQEVKRVLAYPKIAKTYCLDGETTTDFLKGLSIFSEVVEPRKRIKIIKKDPADNKFIEAALAGKADFIVSGDRHLLGLGKYRGIKILTAKVFLDKLRK